MQRAFEHLLRARGAPRARSAPSSICSSGSVAAGTENSRRAASPPSRASRSRSAGSSRSSVSRLASAAASPSANTSPPPVSSISHGISPESEPTTGRRTTATRRSRGRTAPSTSGSSATAARARRAGRSPLPCGRGRGRRATRTREPGISAPSSSARISPLPISDELHGRRQHAHRGEQVAQALALDQPPRVADFEGPAGPPARDRRRPPRAAPRGGASRTSPRAPHLCANRRRALRARRHEGRVAQDLRAQAPDRRGQRAVDVLRRLDAEGDAAAQQRPPPLRGDERERLGLQERHVGRTRSIILPAARGRMALRAGRRARRVCGSRAPSMPAIGDGRSSAPENSLAPARGEHDGRLPAPPAQLGIDLLVDADDGGVADHEQPPAHGCAMGRGGGGRTGASGGASERPPERGVRSGPRPCAQGLASASGIRVARYSLAADYVAS